MNNLEMEMHECPKCGFSQPKDRYCASCGIDIDAFQKQPEPWSQSLKKNTALHAAVAVVLIAGLFTGIYFSQRDAINKTLSEALSVASVPDETETAMANDTDGDRNEVAESSDDIDGDDQMENQSADDNDASLEGATLAGAGALNAEGAEDGESGDDSINAEAIDTLEVTYAEVPRALLQILAAEGQILNESATSRSILLKFSGAIPELRRQEWKPFLLSTMKTHKIQLNQPARENYSTNLKGREAEVGMVVDLMPIQVSSEQVEFDLQLAFNLPTDLGNGVNASTVNGHYIVPHDTTLVIAGLLPQQSVKGEAIQAFSATPLAVLQSPEFLSGASEFVIFIQPK